MKRNNMLRISILPLLIVTALTVSTIQPQQGKGKNDKEEGQSAGKGKSTTRSGNDHSQGNAGVMGKGNDQGNSSNGRDKGNSNVGQGKDNGKDKANNKGNANKGNGNQNKGNAERGYDNERSANGKIKHGKGNSVTMNGKRDVDLDWGFEDFSNRKRPGNQKKVTICHNGGGQNAEYPVTISISENAVQAHLNHGDEIGNCSINYGDRWSSNYIQSREQVYNNYEQTWETMSYSEALLRFAADKLLGIRSDLNRTRTTLSPQEIQRRETLIYELQNNVNALENQVGVTRQRLDSDVNIIIQL